MYIVYCMLKCIIVTVSYLKHTIFCVYFESSLQYTNMAAGQMHSQIWFFNWTWHGSAHMDCVWQGDTTSMYIVHKPRIHRIIMFQFKSESFKKKKKKKVFLSGLICYCRSPLCPSVCLSVSTMCQAACSLPLCSHWNVSYIITIFSSLLSWLLSSFS